MIKGLIFDTKRCAIHDGPGVRTTAFFKGCPLACQWCHNPEGLEYESEIIVRSNRCKEECSACLSVCPSNAISKTGKSIIIDQTKCDICRKCIDVCLYEALDVVGKEVTVRELISEIEKDRIFFDESGGGVTFSGGEPLAQPEFLCSLLKEFKRRGMHTVVDTSGYAQSEIFKKISEVTDLFLYDIKIIDENKHMYYTGVSNRIILENLSHLSYIGKSVVARIPLIKGINDDEKNILDTAEYLVSLKTVKKIDILPYQKGGCEKYRRLIKKIPELKFNSPSSERVKEIKKFLSEYGFSVQLGG